MKRSWVKTNDGSPSLYVPELKQNYHSQHGALQESRHVFLKSGLHQFPERKELSLLEIGFGTGINALLSHFEKAAQVQKLHYHSLEKYPLKPEEWQSISWPELFHEKPAYQSFYQLLHQAEWNQKQAIDPHFELLKEEIDLKNFRPQAESYELIYFDAFSPEAQPDLWTEAIFAQLLYGLKDDGMLVTYCVKGIVRRAMQAAGFTVEKIPGPPGKREMLRAFKSAHR